MGKGLRSNSKKAVRRSRREILLQHSVVLKKREERKQSLLNAIIAAPPTSKDDEDTTKSRPESERRGRLDDVDVKSESDPSAMEEDGRPAINITAMNASRRRRKRSKSLHKQLKPNRFVVTECERNRIFKKREKTDDKGVLEMHLGLRKRVTGRMPDADNMDIVRVSDVTARNKRRLAPGSQWLRIKKVISSRRFFKKPFRGRYKMHLKGITQYYPVKKEEMSVDD